MTKRELKQRFGTLKNAVDVSNKYRENPINYRVFEGLRMDDNIPEERAAFFAIVMLCESMQVDALSLLPPKKKAVTNE